MDEMTSLKDRLNNLAYRYYVLDDPAVSDAEYDALYDKLVALEKSTGVVLPDSPTRRVGGKPLSKFEQVRHLGRLYSLDKCKTREELRAWMDKLCVGGKMPRVSVEYKFDGLTINLTYRDGKLVQAATRGDGVTGEVVTEQVKTIRSVPLSIPYKGVLEVQGEGIMRLSALEEYNSDPTVTPLKNARNAAAGAIRNLDPAQTAKRKLEVVCYNVNYIEGRRFDSGSEMMAFLKEQKFKVSDMYVLADDEETVFGTLDKIERVRPTLDFLIDGAVVKADDFAMREELGYTEKFPRWAMAFKFAAEEMTTTVRDVIWQVSRTGKLNPLAVLDPVDIGGVTVSRATLNNISEIRRKDVRIGSRVFVRRSNDVIPEITGVAEQPEDAVEIEVPTVCPACGSPVEVRGVFAYCTDSEACEPALVSRFSHFVCRDAMDIEGLSDKTLELLYSEGKIRDFADLYSLSADDLTDLEGFKDKKTSNILAAIAASKHTELKRFLFAIGIPGIGKKAAAQLADAFGTLDAVERAQKEELTALDDFGEIMADNVIGFWRDPRRKAEVDRLIAAGITFEQREKTEGAFSGKRVVLTGSLQRYTRSEAKKLIEERGGEVADGVSAKVNLVIAGEAAGSKLDKAKKLGIEIIDETQFVERLGE
ncbi:MAG TPA: NAD-dependent DNA ligase LigA [Candidatus Ornithoclostridium faecigallinarum]|nr:NAD-dependent DNA ligase LigA [Candidatus Ornithoclostridium faecigallinarum]